MWCTISIGRKTKCNARRLCALYKVSLIAFNLTLLWIVNHITLFDRCDDAAELYAICPFRIVEDENEVTITVKAFFYNNIYKINKISMEVHYEKSLEGKGSHKLGGGKIFIL